MPTRTGEAIWRGSFKRGSGTVAVASGLFKADYSAASRFEHGAGTNPEELLAAAHSGCFSMALALGLGEAGFEPNSIHTTAQVTIERIGGGYRITKIELSTEADIPGIDEQTFLRHAEAMKKGCPVSQALAATPIELVARLLPSQPEASPQP
ncbi:MAG: OsmC family protein [Myxococcales bacterium]|jgi:osmotically inducible protein OsmC